MALITDREAPADVPEANPNVLNDLPDDLLGGPKPPAYLKMGTSPYAVSDPPEIGDERLFCVKLVCKGFGGGQQSDGKLVHSRTMRCVKMWPLGEDEPEDPKTDEELAAENQPPLYGDDGEPVDTEGEPVDNVVRPEFSDGGK